MRFNKDIICNNSVVLQENKRRETFREYAADASRNKNINQNLNQSPQRVNFGVGHWKRVEAASREQNMAAEHGRIMDERTEDSSVDAAPE